MPTQSETLAELRNECKPGELPYISKSRVTTYKTCPRKFYYQYIKGLKTPTNFYMKRGTEIHEVYEKYYENLLKHYDATGEIPVDLDDLLPSVDDWSHWVEPFISNFLLFEEERRHAVYEAVESGAVEIDRAEEGAEMFLPVGIEAEGWDWDQAPPWMGYADVILHAASLPEIESNRGVVIVDFKTGRTPDPKYRDDGIFLEGEYYSVLFEDNWDIAAVAGYFPKNHDLVVSPLDAERRERIFRYIGEMNENKDREDFPVNEIPLCKWGPDDDQQCDFYNICSTRWGKQGGPGPTYS